MSELRLNPITREWVIIATERAVRPDNFVRYKTEVLPLTYVESCPFCRGNEGVTPEEIMRLPEHGDWQVRLTSNKFPALSSNVPKRHATNGMCESMGGHGHHEVVIESPAHNRYIAQMEIAEIEAILHAYRMRFEALYEDPDVEHVIIFKNHGEAAGTSLIHPHSQIIALPMIPLQVQDRMLAYRYYFEEKSECLMCATLRDEVSDGRRVLLESEYFVSFIPYAALSPFHTWIFPKQHQVCFGAIKEDQLIDLARQLKYVLERLFVGLGNPSFNYVLRSAAPGTEAEGFHWYISLVPRLSQHAGFELGSGMYINSAIPEESAKFFRNIKLPA